MKARTGGEMRELDRRAIQECGIPGIWLMEKAGAAVARCAEILAKPFAEPDFVILAGKGNNGGDAFVAARLLIKKEFHCQLYLTHPPEELSGDAAEAFRRLPEWMQESVKFNLTAHDFSPESVVIDGLLGTGIAGVPRYPVKEWIECVNESGQPVLAIDIPSGLNAETGESECCVQADMTITLAAYKRGMFYGHGPQACGIVRLAPIGFPKTLLDEETFGDTELFTEYDFRKSYRKEMFNTHKNQRGTLLVAGGSSDYSGAPYLAAVSALRGGAGIVTLLVPEHAEKKSAPNALIVRSVPDNGSGCWTSAAEEILQETIKKSDAIVFGPGITTDFRALPVLKLLLSANLPMVLDADGLNLLAEHPHLSSYLHDHVILTPHPGEFRRLQKAFGLPSEGGRQEQAYELALHTGTTVILKGQHTVVASPDGFVTLNVSGTPALATAGSGDCLAGLCGAFLSGGYPASTAARMAVFLHGRAAERAAEAGTHGLIADDLPNFYTISGVFV